MTSTERNKAKRDKWLPTAFPHSKKPSVSSLSQNSKLLKPTPSLLSPSLSFLNRSPVFETEKTMSKQDLAKVQSCLLKVNIHCEGCEQKVKKLLQKIDGVYSVIIDAERGKVLVAGDVDPAKLIKKLKSSGKHAELWGAQAQRGMAYNPNFPNNQFKNLQIDNGKGGKDNKSHKGGAKQQRGGGAQPAQFQNNKGAKDLKVPPKEQKSVKFNLPEDEFDASDDGFDEFDEFDDDFDDYDDEEEEENYGHGHGHGQMHHMPGKMMPVMGNGRGPHGPSGMINGPAMGKNKGNGGGGGSGSVNAKKGDVLDLPVHTNKNGKGGTNDLKTGKEGKRNDGGGDGGKKNKGSGGGNRNGGGGNKNNAKSGGGLLGRFLGFAKKSEKGRGANGSSNKNKKNGNDDGSGNDKSKEGKKSGGKFEGYDRKMNKIDDDDFDFDLPRNGKGNGDVGQKGPMGQTRNIPPGQGLPATAPMNGGYYQGMQMQPPPYDQRQQQQLQLQQQYMAMMNMMHQQQQQQQQANMNNMYPPNPMMHGRPQAPPHLSMNYMGPPPMPSHPMADPITHVFSDENTESCAVM
ncbi:hypothetical protein L6164_010531 [Bauhinia variegata]|uniref:Uncharacterized protein n=1 Tax=Bauhinia variegata TaxID=167791 RepID=A0ACB9PNI4_BAUVA|nr:hypothetical protein L6164_010531 [Bauhinia variegata]